jgi:hypothetical protein
MNPTSGMARFLAAIPRWLGTRIWILFLLLLLVYLVGIGGLGIIYPAIAPSANAQLILGNLTNVASALAASIAAASGTTAAVVAVQVVKENRVHHAAVRAHEAVVQQAHEAQHLFREQMRENMGIEHP